MEVSQIVTISLSVMAFILSVASLLFTVIHRQKNTEATDTRDRNRAFIELGILVGKLNEFLHESKMLRSTNPETSKHWSDVSKLKNINDERRVLIRTIRILIDSVEGNVDNMVYATVAITYESFGRYDDAEEFWLLSIKRAEEEGQSVDAMFNRKGYAHHLSLGGKIDHAREQYQMGLRDLDRQADSNQTRFNKGELCRSWALAEARVHSFTSAEEKLREAYAYYNSITYTVLKRDGLHFYMQRVSDVKLMKDKFSNGESFEINVPVPNKEELNLLSNVPVHS